MKQKLPALAKRTVTARYSSKRSQKGINRVGTSTITATEDWG